MSSSSSKKDPLLLAAVEGGGTSFKVVVCEIDRRDVNDDGGDDDSTETTTTSRTTVSSSSSRKGGATFIVPTIVARSEMDSSHDHPSQTLQEIQAFLQGFLKAKNATDKRRVSFDALGLISFGPVGIRSHHPEEFGCILPTSPKPAWRGVDLLQPILKGCHLGDDTPFTSNKIPVLVETDVNAPALSEYLQFNANVPEGQGPISSLAYVTVGTGVGVGLIVNGQPVHGTMHPEGGHISVQPLSDDLFLGYSWGPSRSPFQGKHTVEGITSSIALIERLQQRLQSKDRLERSILSTLKDDDELWDHSANALANLCVTLMLMLSIERIVLGGGIIMHRHEILLPKIRARTQELLNGYLPHTSDADMEKLIVLPSFGGDAGLVGAMVIASRAAKKKADNDKVKQTKQIAYGNGLWHGIMVGSLSVALFCKYVWLPAARVRK